MQTELQEGMLKFSATGIFFVYCIMFTIGGICHWNNVFCLLIRSCGNSQGEAFPAGVEKARLVRG